jgi:ATP synthase subunit 6
MVLQNFFFNEPLEQFEIFKIGYLYWADTLAIFNLSTFDIVNNYSFLKINLLSNLINLDNLGILDIKYLLLIILPYNNNHVINLSYDFFDFILIDSLVWGLDFNNTIIYFLLLLSVILVLIIPNIINLYIIPTNWQFVLETIYIFIKEMIIAQIGKEAQRFFPYIFSIFVFILISNILGMFLFSFTLTSHIMVTFTLGVSSFIGLTITGFIIQKIDFLHLFLPKGVPSLLLPMLIIIETISYFLRALSLSVRLFANLMSGHILLHILAFFSSKLFKFNLLVGIVSFILILAIVSLEFCIAALQAYVFAVLVCIYLNDSFHTH